MRVVVFGAGAIGGLVGARLFQHGVDVTLVARGAHAEALASGLVLEAPDESVTLPIPVVTEAAALRWTDDTVVLLAVKGQDTEEALTQLVTVAPPETPIVCMQNGVENERRVLRRFPRTYAMCVMCPASHLRPGVIVAHSAPVSGLLDLGRYPSGVDDVAESHRRGPAAIDVRVGGPARHHALEVPQAHHEPGQCRRGPEWARRAGTAPWPGRPAGRARRSSRRRVSPWRRPRRIWPAGVIICSIRPTPSGGRGGGSSWQSLERGTGSIEAEFLNGEIVLLGALHGVDAPVNRRLMVLALQAAADGTPGGLLGHRGAQRGGGCPHATGEGRRAGCQSPWSAARTSSVGLVTAGPGVSILTKWTVPENGAGGR